MLLLIILKAISFLDLIYSNKKYIKHFESKKNNKRCTSANNWRQNGNYICDSLHKANNIYEGFGKNKWCNEWKRKSIEKSINSNTWNNYLDPEKRCVVITQKNTQCRFSRTFKCKDSNMCSHHLKHYNISKRRKKLSFIN